MPASASRRVASARSSRQLIALLPRELARPLIGGKRLDDLVEIAVEHAVERVHRETDAVVGDAVVLVVVGADLLGTTATLHLVASRRAHLVGLPVLFGLQQPGAQDAHRLIAVLQLALLVLAGDDKTGGLVRDSHGRVGGV